MRIVLPFAAVALSLLISAGSITTNSDIPHIQGSAVFDGVGFAWGEDRNSFAVARTRDGGTTWERLGSPSIASDTLGPGGWATRSTADGGTTWNEVLAQPTDAQLDGELFPGPGHACLRAQMAEGTMHTTTVLIATDDSGATWSVNDFPGDGVTGWTFRDSSLGFVSTLSPASAEIRLWRTSDGGKTWTRVPVALPADLTDNDVDEVAPGSVVFAQQVSRIATLPISLGLAQGKVVVTYRTDDEGLTWTPQKSNTP